MPEMHLWLPRFTYSAWGLFTKNKKWLKKKRKRDSRYIYQKELDKISFQHDTAFEDYEHLARRTAPDKILRDKAFNIAKNPKYNGCHCREGKSKECKSIKIWVDKGSEFCEIMVRKKWHRNIFNA